MPCYHKNGNLPLFCIEKDTRGGAKYAPFACVLMVRATGLEPAHRRYKILNLTCLPISPRPPFGVVKFFHTRPPFGARGIRAQKGWTLCASMHYCTMFSGFCQALFRYLYQLTEAQESVPLSLPHCTLIFPPKPP